jgi:hypothetical protein
VKRSVLGEIQVVSVVRFVKQTTPNLERTTARGGGKEQHNSVGQSRGVGAGAPHNGQATPHIEEGAKETQSLSRLPPYLVDVSRADKSCVKGF